MGRHRPFVKTGRLDGQLEHWLNVAPEQVSQSGWQVRHIPEELNVLLGQVDTQEPCEASWLLVHVRQKAEDPAQVEQLESHAVHVTLSVEEMKFPVGQLSTHWPPERTKPGRQPVHCSWLTVDATLKLGILQPVHLEGQPKN